LDGLSPESFWRGYLERCWRTGEALESLKRVVEATALPEL
jgi:hypothetical protein